ncbi:hypothetical protein NFJ02_22g49910 [Pycnococcus provasolii]
MVVVRARHVRQPVVCCNSVPRAGNKTRLSKYTRKQSGEGKSGDSEKVNRGACDFTQRRNNSTSVHKTTSSLTASDACTPLRWKRVKSYQTQPPRCPSSGRPACQ